MAAQPPQRESTHCTLEPVPKSEIPSTYIYSVPDRSVPYAVDSTPAHAHPETAHTPSTPRKPSRTRWFLPLLYGLLIAIAAGVAGGFIGKAIAISDNRGRLPRTQPSSYPTTTAPNNASSPTSSVAIFQRNIPVPTTGCTPPTTQRSFKSFTSFLDASYTTFCMTGWQRDELVALSAATPSDCIEACVMYNGHRAASDRTCVSGGFMPEWWNQSQAMDESGGMPYNCFLKSNDSGVGRNDRAIEVVSLCMPGACQGVLG